MYLALYGPQGLVIFDHPYNDDDDALQVNRWAALARPQNAFPGSIAGPAKSVVRLRLPRW